jgi:hypothetical protein
LFPYIYRLRPAITNSSPPYQWGEYITTDPLKFLSTKFLENGQDDSLADNFAQNLFGTCSSLSMSVLDKER